MDFGHTEQEQELCDAFGRFFAQRSSPSVVRAAEPGGFDPVLWEAVVALGVPGMALPVADGGASFVELVLLCELAGASLAPVPIVESLACGRGLSRLRHHGDTRAKDVVDEVIEELGGGTIGSLALAPVPAAGGTQIVPGGSVAEVVLAEVGDSLVLLRAGADRVRRYSHVHGSAPMAAWDLTPRPGDVELVSHGGGVLAAAMRDEWKVLGAAALLGLTGRALEIGAAYATSRLAFGTPIGTFQGVAHPLADSATEARGAQLLVRRVAWLIDEGRDNAVAHLASLVWGFCGPAATRATARCVHIHGGYGSALEYDIQLYHQRARAWASVLGDPVEELRLAGDRLLADPEDADAWISI